QEQGHQGRSSGVSRCSRGSIGEHTVKRKGGLTRKTRAPRIPVKAQEDLNRLSTEQPNRASVDLDLKTSLEIVRMINAEDAKVVEAVRRALPQIARAVGLIANALKRGGRLIYVGAGTSGRLAALDAAECPPTFNVDPRTVQFIMAGGPAALASAIEGDEDSRELG